VRVAVACVALLFLALGASASATSGSFDRTWGKDVIGGGATGYEICAVAAFCKQGEIGVQNGEFKHPTDAATDSAGNAYVADEDHRIQKFDAAGTYLSTFGGPGDLGGQFVFPQGVAVDAAGNVYVADENQRITKFSPAGAFQAAWGKDVVLGNAEMGFETCVSANLCKSGLFGTLGGELKHPGGLATDATGVYVADKGNHRVQKFSFSGAFLGAWGKDVSVGGILVDAEICTDRLDCKQGEVGGAGGEFNQPEDVAADGAGHVYISELSNNRVQKFDSAGNFERAWGQDVVQPMQPGNLGTGPEICTVKTACKAGSAGGFAGGDVPGPRSVAVDSAGFVYAGDSIHRIQKFDSAGDFLVAFGSLGTAAGQFDTPEGLGAGAGAGESLFVADYGNNRAQKFADPPLPPVTIPAVALFDLRAAVKRCKKKFPKGSKKRKKCIKKARARAGA
jgi:DNA-binding beta-propeller fold protein YncE